MNLFEKLWISISRPFVRLYYLGDIEPKFIEAAGAGDLKAAQFFHKYGADITSQDNKAFISAAYNGRLDMAEWLYENGADITAQNNQAVIWAARNGDLDMAEWLYENGADITAQNNGAVIGASCNGRLDMVKWLHENGADITAKNNTAVLLAAHLGHLDMVPYLIELGADISAHDGKVESPLKQAIKYNKYETVALLKAVPKIEKTIAEWQEKDPFLQKADVRHLFYTAACVASRITQNPEELHAQMLKIVSNSVDRTVLDPKQHSPEVEASLHKKVANAAQKIGFAYPQLQNFMDATDAYVETVLLGQWLLDSGRKSKDIEEKELPEITKQLRPVAAKILYGEKSVIEIIRYSESWHHNALPDAMRPLKAGAWHPVIESVITPIKITIDEVEHPITITPLCSHDALKKESSTLDHCVGNGGYGTKCMAGKIHILSLQAGGTPLGTLEVMLNADNPKKPFTVKQFRGEKNGKVPAEAQQAWDWLESQKIYINPMPEGGWGETPQSKIAIKNPAIIKQIGYIPTLEHVAACHQHYTNGFRIKQEFIGREERGVSLGSAPRYALKHRFIDPIGADLPTAITAQGAEGGNLAKLLQAGGRHL